MKLDSLYLSDKNETILKFWAGENMSTTAQSLLALLLQKLDQGSICINLDQPISYTRNNDESIENITLSEEDKYALSQDPHLYLSQEKEPEELQPLVLSNGQIYLQKYWKLEQILLALIYSKVATNIAQPIPFKDLPSKTQITQEQTQAITKCLQNPISLITGGPGTGKTTIIARLLHSISQASETSGKTRIALAAPTGKAATRMMESLQNEFGETNASISTLPEKAFTIHRLLGVNPKQATYKYNAKNPLPYDVIVLDEATMIDLPLMVSLFQAMEPSTQVIMLGDENQLSAVGIGSVFADLVNLFTSKKEIVTKLSKTFRFGENSGIFSICESIKQGDVSSAMSHLQANFPDLNWIANIEAWADLKTHLDHHITEYLSPNLSITEPQQALDALSNFIILSPQKSGPSGIENINFYISKYLHPQNPTAIYHGKPIMVTTNDYQNSLFNGDIGIFLASPTGELRAYFKTSAGITCFTQSQLPEYQTAYALTIHKSQGSEYNNLLILLPDTHENLLTRELLYTGISRAKKTVTLAATQQTITSTINKKSERASGI